MSGVLEEMGDPLCEVVSLTTAMEKPNLLNRRARIAKSINYSW